MARPGCIETTETAMRAALQAAQDEAVQNVLAPVASKQPTGYFSTVRWFAANTGIAPAFLWQIPPTPRVGFNYIQGGVMDGAGFAPGTIATGRHTNLSKASETRAGETYYIKGVSYHVAPLDLFGGGPSTAVNEPSLAFSVWANCFAQLSMNGGTDIWPLGPLFFFPAISGLSGIGTSTVLSPGLPDAFGTLAGIQNGQQEADNYFEFADPLIWTPSGETDSQLNWIFITPGTGIPMAATARAAGAGVQQFEPPDVLALDVTVRLIGHSIAKLSTNK